MTRWLVTGAGGMLGRELVDILSTDPGAQVAAAARTALDITDTAAVRRAVTGRDIVVNTAAWTDVDGAESQEGAATRVNGDGVGVLAAACAATGARLLQISTDYVFAGDAHTPYREDAPLAPVNAYGRSKAAGEAAVGELLPDAGYVVRTAWLYGRHGRSFLRTVLGRVAAGEPVRVVDDQYGQPTWARALAERLVLLGNRAVRGQAPAGIYHGTASGQASWYELALTAVRSAGLDTRLLGRDSAGNLTRRAVRPAYSVLGQEGWDRAGLPPMPHWTDMLGEALATGGFVMPGTRH
ncbi:MULTISPECIES: dTDP-4-dehydrorhamnose reductase [unclassified Streptomyces]|uniref:dTDP-4-dehydrorhamnose reductase n=1 Tax=unclassified Streptomyces TaxID=2593676 RepID=UPI0033C99C08